MQAKNDFKLVGDIAILLLSRRDGSFMETMIDAEDLPRVAHLRWCPYQNPASGYWYARSKFPPDYKRNGWLHRVVMSAPAGLVVDHLHHQTLDNRKSQLRLATASENGLNLKGPHGSNRSSGIRGVNAVSYDPTRFQARVRLNGKSQYLGVFGSKELAAEAVERKLAELGLPNHA